VAGDWRRLHTEELHNMHATPNITSVIKSKRMKWAGLVARMGEIINAYRLLVGKRRSRWEDDTGNREESCGLDSCGSGLRPVAGL
jgi:hypothetical protein